MARASTITKLSLDEWAAVMGFHPLHFSGVYVEPLTLCAQPWMQFAWQDVDRVGREDVARAIAKAEADIEQQLRYRLLPTWEVDEFAPTARAWRREFVNLSSRDVRGMQQVAFTKRKHFISGGVEAKTVVQAGAAIVYSDADSDGYFETATVTQAVTFTDPCEVAIYYPGRAGASEWEIRPISVSIAAGVATITFRREQAVLPGLMSDITPAAVLGTDNAKFLTTVDVYRHYNDPQTQVMLLWEPFSECNCGTSTCQLCAFSAQTGCLMPREDPELGVVAYRPGTWDAATATFTPVAWAVARQPDLLRLWYRAGLRDMSLPCPTRAMDRDWAYTVAVYAASMLDRPMCECNNIHQWIEHWRADLVAELENVSYKISARNLDNPFGTRRGAVYAWNQVKQADIVQESVHA